MLERTDPFGLRVLFDYYSFLARELGDLEQDRRFLRALRRAVFTPPGEGPPHARTDLFPPLEVTPHPALAGKRVALVASGGSGSLVALCGVKRALEEAGVELAAVSVCSGSAIWGSMIAAGFSAQQMVEESLRWTPRDVIDFDWRAMAEFPLKLGKGFKGFVKGEALERTLDRIYHGMRLKDAAIPYYAVVLNIDTNQIDYFGAHNQPEVKLATMARMAISLPLFVHPVKFGEHYYVDGGVVNVFPVDPLLEVEASPFDLYIGVNTILPPAFAGGEDITGWTERPIGILDMSRQLWHAQHIVLARHQLDLIRDRTLLLEPLPYTEIHGSKFYEIFLDTSRWPDLILRSYRYTRERLRRFS